MTLDARLWSGLGRRIWTRYLVIVGATTAAMFVAYLGLLGSLERASSLPPPAISNEVCTDEKLKWLRGQPAATVDPNILVIGSSIAWRDIDSSQLVQRIPGARPLNGGFCHASANQTAFISDYLVAHFPTIKTIIAVFVPQDFEDCTRTPSKLFDPNVASRYVFDHSWSLRFYVTQFDPVSLVRNALVIKSWRAGRGWDTLEMTPYGDGPLRVSGNRGLLYGKMLNGIDSACFAAIHRIAIAAAANGRRLLVLTGPLNPEWIQEADPDGTLRNTMRNGIISALAGLPGTRFWDGSAAFVAPFSDFTDAIHINWSAATSFSTLVAGQVARVIAAPL